MVLLTDIGWHLCWTVLVTELPVLSSKLGNSGGFRVIRCSAMSNEKGKARMEPLSGLLSTPVLLLLAALFLKACGFLIVFFTFSDPMWLGQVYTDLEFISVSYRGCFLLYHVASHGKAGWRKWCREFWLRAEHVTEWVLLWRSDSGLRGLHGLPPSLCFWKTIVR